MIPKWVVKINRSCFDTDARLHMFKKSLELKAVKDRNAPSWQWVFQFSDELTYMEFWTYVQTFRPLELT